MSSLIQEEFERFRKLFSNYGKVIVGGMLLSGIFLFLYAGIRANYVSIAVLSAVLSTISLSSVMLLLYVRFHEKRWKTQSHNRSIREELSERNRTDDEQLKKLIVETIAGFSSTQTKTSSKSTLRVAEHVLLSVFKWGNLIARIFYYGLTTVKLQSGFGKGPKEV